jgi:hypothetical protein
MSGIAAAIEWTGPGRWSRRGLLLWTLVALLFALEARADPLSGRELQRKIIGHTWAWKSEKFGTSGVSSYYRDGRVIVTVDGYRPEWGRWRIKDNQLCVTLAGNSENCSEDVVERDSRTYYSTASQTTLTLRE